MLTLQVFFTVTDGSLTKALALGAKIKILQHYPPATLITTVVMSVEDGEMFPRNMEPHNCIILDRTKRHFVEGGER
jgi:hypothetical protein